MAKAKKKCSRCGVLKSLDSFHKNSHGRLGDPVTMKYPGRRPECKACVKKRQQKIQLTQESQT